jgi:hypothetical protein
MERGPLALFGAIIAVGLGPALWMGVQIGSIPTSPARPPAAVTDQNKVTGEQLVGGTGAGDETSSSSDVDSEPRGNVLPLSTSPTATPKPAATRSSSPSATAPSESVSPSESTSDSTGEETGDPSYPPTEATTSPSETGEATTEPTDHTDPPGDGDGDGDDHDDETEDPTWPPDHSYSSDDDDKARGWVAAEGAR